MALRKTWGERLGAMLKVFSDRRGRAREILERRFLERQDHVQRLFHYAERMQYPHFGKRLQAIADDESRHVQWLVEAIHSLGASAPEAPQRAFSAKSSWEYLRAELEERGQCAAELMVEINLFRGEFAGIAATLERIHGDGIRHRNEISEMLMRSDPQAHWAA